MFKSNVFDDPPPSYSAIVNNNRVVPFNSRGNNNNSRDNNSQCDSWGNNSRIINVINEESDPLINKIHNEVCIDIRAFCVLVFILMIVISFGVALSPGTKHHIPDDDVTKVPRTFQLRWRSIFGDDYTMVIESYDKDFKSLSGYDDTFNFSNDTSFGEFNAEPSINVTDNQIKYPIRAHILDRNYNSGDYSVEEYFYKPNKEYYYKRMITANAEFKGNWPAEFLITFTSEGKDRNPASVEVCDYMLSYSKDLTGRVLRKCTKALETNFSMQAYVYGSVGDGLYFTEAEKSDTWYAFTTKPSWVITYSKRDIFVREHAPFPPLIPALYSVYYDFLSRTIPS